MQGKKARLEELARRIKACTRCSLYRNRRNAVPGEGNPDANVMFIGEAPGFNEDVQGRPFVGAAGKLLTGLIESIGLTRGDVYITNIVKCRPPGNRDPLKEEVEACKPYLIEQLGIIEPSIIVSLGRHSTRLFFQFANLEFKSIMRVRGSPRVLVINGVEYTLLPTLHPAAALYNPGLRSLLERDFMVLAQLLRKRRGDLTDWLS